MTRLNSRLLNGFLVFFLLLTASPGQPVAAQAGTDAPVYVIQSGDTLYSIALKFGVTTNDLIAANNLVDPNALAQGQELVIPGLQGITGKLITQGIPLGQNLDGLARYFNVPVDRLITLNRLTSPAEVYAGANLIIPQANSPQYFRPISSLAPGESTLEVAAAQGSSPWQISLDNKAFSPTNLLPGESLVARSNEEVPPSNPLAPLVSEIKLAPLPLVQGSTIVIRVKTDGPADLSGTLNGRELHFFPEEDNTQVAIQGVHAMAEPGLAPFSLTASANGKTVSFEQLVLLQAGFFAEDPPLAVDPSTIDPAVTKPEEDLVKKIISPVSSEKLWSGLFKIPVDEPSCIKSWFGNRRSYNGGPYAYFHTGLDYGVCANLNILAPAAGVVVFSGPLDVRGIATYIDHGWGIYSAYFHQKETLVKVGDRVEPGQVIGQIGGTGRVTGPHLHFEIWANRVQVNPEDWLARAYP